MPIKKKFLFKSEKLFSRKRVCVHQRLNCVQKTHAHSYLPLEAPFLLKTLEDSGLTNTKFLPLLCRTKKVDQIRRRLWPESTAPHNQLPREHSQRPLALLLAAQNSSSLLQHNPLQARAPRRLALQVFAPPLPPEMGN